MLGWYVLSENSKGQFWFVLKAANAETILQSEMYNSKAAAQKGITSVQKNCILDARYEKKKAKNGEFFFHLKAGNGQIIGRGETYTTEAMCDKGLASVKKNGVSGVVKMGEEGTKAKK